MAARLATAPATARVTPGPVHLPPPPLQSFDGRWVLDAARSEFGSAASRLRAREDEIATDGERGHPAGGESGAPPSGLAPREDEVCRGGERVRVRSRAVRASGDSTSLD